jgi:hypothetical protein
LEPARLLQPLITCAKIFHSDRIPAKMGHCDANHFGTTPMHKLFATSLICLAVSGTAADAQGSPHWNMVKSVPRLIEIIRPSPALVHELDTASRFSMALLSRQQPVTRSLMTGTDPGTVMQMFNNSAALSASMAGRAPALPALTSATKEAMVTISLLDGKIKIGELKRFGPVSIKGGELEVYKLAAYGATAAVAYCTLNSCAYQVPTGAEVNIPELEQDDDEPTPAKVKTPSNSTKQ